MALPDLSQNTPLGIAALGGFAIRWLWQEVRARRKDIQTDQSEAISIKNLKAEISRLSARMELMEKKLGERDQEVEAERKLRRHAEDERDRAVLRCSDLEDQIAELEGGRGTT